MEDNITIIIRNILSNNNFNKIILIYKSGKQIKENEFKIMV